MVFSSLEFLFRFFPVFIIAYILVKEEYRLYVILAGSLVFYSFGEPLYIFLMLFSIVVNHYIAGAIYKRRQIVGSEKEKRAKAKGLVVFATIIDIGLLFIFKYLEFFISIINGIAGSEVLPKVELALPLGISFYTFQIMSYIFDVYRGKYKAEKNILKYATFISFFPQIVQGPISRFNDLQKQNI